MRDYSKVSGQFWTGRTGKRLRGDMEGQLVALYLMTSPHANMIGAYWVPLSHIAYETGLPFEGASKGLQSCSKALFCTYDADTEEVLVFEMAAHQVGDELKPGDNRIKAVQKLIDEVSSSHIYQAFMERYAVPFGLAAKKGLQRPSKAPSKPEAGTGTEVGAGKAKALAQQAARFPEFWAAYPVKKGRKEALAAWTRRGLDAIADQIIADVEARKQRDRQWLDGFAPHGSTYVNANGWEDEIETRRPNGSAMAQASGGDFFGGAE